ncbi:mitochondrial glycoprotein domain-containing protein [Ditylenchus destructor]|uniref:Mitochondrial glycoprotein domain-containing protein n=1 Tax=Ditylenchus destructor TaxID=166010 RepID=A0AAD4NGV4_9BILA|nr:mitochondrial glycoprotein domain-containing protein [Ditylenchus destructor]
MFSPRFASTATRSLITSSLRSLTKKTPLVNAVLGSRLICPNASVRLFSSTSIKLNATQQELCQALETEIDAEKKLEVENLGGTSAPVIDGFKVSSNGAKVQLTKTHGSEKIMVFWSVNGTVDMGDEFPEEDQDPENPQMPLSVPDFTIEITKGGQRLCFECELFPSEDNQYDFNVSDFSVAPAAKDDNYDVDESVYFSTGKFIDPSLHGLLFVKYLEERGFTSEFCTQLVNFSTHYEHSQYVKLLEKIKGFVKA